MVTSKEKTKASAKSLWQGSSRGSTSEGGSHGTGHGAWGAGYGARVAGHGARAGSRLESSHILGRILYLDI